MTGLDGTSHVGTVQVRVGQVRTILIVKRVFKGVLMIFRRCSKGVSVVPWVLQGCFKGILRVF